MNECGGICYHLRRWLFLSIIWIPLVIIFWWAWGWELVNGDWTKYLSAKPLTQTVEPGGSMRVHWVYEILHDCPRDIEMRLVRQPDSAEEYPVNQEILLYSHKGRTTGKGVGIREFTSNIKIPDNITPGEYTLQSSSTGYCTPLHSSTVRGQLIPFTVIKGTE